MASRSVALLSLLRVQDSQRGVLGLYARRMRRHRRRTRQRMAFLLVFMLLLDQAMVPRSTWMKPRFVVTVVAFHAYLHRMMSHVCVLYVHRSSQFWEKIVLETFGPVEWIENFRMSRETFGYLCDKLRPSISRQTTKLRRAVSTEKRVAITLWCLATPSEYRTIAHLFGVGRSTVCTVVQETCRVIVRTLMNTYIEFPTGDNLKKVINQFEHKWGLPQCSGAIDGSHIPIAAPELNHTDYYNRKGWYSMLVQAIVDADYIFRDICVGWPGSVHDARVFANSKIYERITEENLLANEQTRVFHGCRIPVFIVGDSAYPLKTWLMKPFADTGSLTAQQKCYNYRLSRARIVVENAFGRLKARWRRLLKRNDMSIKNIPNIISACCILHNLCEIHGESFNQSWLQDNETFRQPHPTPITCQTTCGSAAEDIRTSLMQYLFSQ